MKLISCTDFVLEFGKETNRYNYEQAYDKISAYARFLKQPLRLGMFVKCKCKDINEEVLFYGFHCTEKHFISNNDIDIYFDDDTIKVYDGKEMFIVKTIEDLVKYNLILTESAKKQILGL